MLNERKLTADELKKREEIIQNMLNNKQEIVKRYGKDAEKMIYGRATKMVQKQSEKQMENTKLKEMIKSALMNPVKEMDIEVGADRYEGEKALGQASVLLDDLEAMLKNHDWFFYMSDDPRVYNNEEPSRRIQNAVNQLTALGYGDDAKKLYNQYAPSGDIDMRMKEGKKEDVDKDGDIDSKDYLAKRDAAIKKAKGDIDESGYREMTDSERSKKQYMDQQLKRLSDLKKRQEDKERLLKLQQKLHQDRIEPFMKEDIDLGHEDNEPHMLKGDIYRIGKYAMELYQMVDEFEGRGEVDFPHWWQSKIIKAKDMLVAAKHYLDFETKEPQIDAMLDIADQSGVFDNVGVEEPALGEKLTSKTPMKTYIKDFAKSDAPQFKGKSEEKKRQMAVAAKLSKQLKEEGFFNQKKSLEEYLTDGTIDEGFLDRLKANLQGIKSTVGTSIGNVAAVLKGDKDAIKNVALARNMAKLQQKSVTLDKELVDVMQDLGKMFPPEVLQNTPEEFQTVLVNYANMLDKTLELNKQLATGEIKASTSAQTPPASDTTKKTDTKTTSTSSKPRDEKGRFTSTKTSTSAPKTDPISNEYEVTDEVYSYKGKDYTVQVDKKTKEKFFKHEDGRIMDIANLEKFSQAKKKTVAEILAKQLKR